MNFFKVVLVTAIMSIAVFAQDTVFVIINETSGAKNETSGAKKGPNLRFSGDISLNPGFEFQNNYDFEDIYYGAIPVGNIKYDNKSNAFNIQYGWNVLFGLDFGDKISVDFRLSNPNGYGLDYLNFADGSAKGYIPTLPNAYFTWKPGSVFSFKGGLLEVEGSTVLDLVAGYESDEGLWTDYSSWSQVYNNSQAGLKFGFDFSDNFSLNLTTALVSPTNTLDYEGYLVYGYYNGQIDADFIDDYVHNEFRFILDANISLGDVVTLKPMLQTRSFWSYYRELTGVNPITSDYEYKMKTPILVAYGTDIDFNFNDAFNLNAGLALGNIRLNKFSSITSVNGVHNNGSDDTMFGFLLKFAPSLNFGINELWLNYSLGIGTFKSKMTIPVYNPIIDDYIPSKVEEKYSRTFNDLAFTWNFRVNDNFAFGPGISMAFRSDKESDNGIETPYSNKKTSGYNWLRFGLNFTASF